MPSYKEILLKKKQRALVKHYLFFMVGIIFIYWICHVYSFHSFFNLSVYTTFGILLLFICGGYIVTNKLHISFKSLVNYYIIFIVILVTFVGIIFLPLHPILFIHLIPVPLAIYMVDGIKVAIRSTLVLILLFSSFFLINPDPKIFFFIVHVHNHPPFISLMINLLPIISSTYTIMLLSYYMNEFNIIKLMPDEEEAVSSIQSKDPSKDIPKKNSLDKFNNLYENIIYYFEQKKPYQNPDFNIYMLAEELNTNRTYISNALNKKGNISFQSFVNVYRIKQVKEHLDNNDYKRYTLKYISTQAGFKYQTTFNTVFKEIVGISPSEYIQLLDLGNNNFTQPS